MAEGVLFDLATKLLEVLASKISEEISLAWGVKDEIHKLKETVSTIKAVLLDAEKRYSQESQEAVKVWLRRLKDVFYDADDLLDDFSTQLLKRQAMTGNKMIKAVRLFFSKHNQIAYGLNMADKIKNIRKKLVEINNNRNFHLIENPYPIQNMGRETHSFVIQEKVIGRDEDKTAVVQLLLESNDTENVSIIPIVGIGGLGKTTLVQSVYNIEKVINHFELRLWVCVSDDFNVKMIVQKIIKSATANESANLEMDQLQNQLRGIIDGKKYLLVLDDIWNEDPLRWTELKDLLMNGAKGSKILVTTRSNQVAKITSKHPSYVLRQLDDRNSWSLFSQIASEYQLDLEDDSLVSIAKEILAKCVGVPLAINTIGHLLCINHSKDDWLHFRDTKLSKIAQESSGIFPILELSYQHLPSHLKQCFAYCALFPKDSVIEKSNLLYLWMAQGFLHSVNNNKCLEEVGNDCFMTLLSRSFFQEAEYDESGHVTKCKMHDLMHDLAQSVAGIECTVATPNTEIVDEGCRHVSIEDQDINSSLKFPDALLKAKSIRTFLVRADGTRTFRMLCLSDGDTRSLSEFDYTCCSKILSSFKYLRSLRLSGLGLLKVPALIGELKHLRYLDLSNNPLRKLPDSVSKLVNLEILDISGTRLRQLPRGAKNMVSLKHLFVEGCDDLTKMPYGLGSLTGLQTLELFLVSNQNGVFSELRELRNLRGKLTIRIPEDCKEDSSLANLEAKPYLKSLKLEWDRGSEFNKNTVDEVLLESLKPNQNLESFNINSFAGVNLPRWLSSLTNLTSITLDRCYCCLYIPPLDQLPFLERLDLSDVRNLEYISGKESNHSFSKQPATTFFPSLKELTISGCLTLESWWKRKDENVKVATTNMTTEHPSFPCLSKLMIRYCPNLTCMPLFPSLEELHLEETSSKPLLQTMMMMKTTAPQSTLSGFSAPLCKLKSLYMTGIEDLESLPMEGMGNLTSLERMSISACDNFIYDDNNNDMRWSGPRSLHYVDVNNLLKLKSLPNWLEYATNLVIFNCDNLESLPEGMEVQKLEIISCNRLSQRYMDHDWPQIAHIPNIRVDWKWIQKEDSYQLNSEAFSSP